MSVTQPERVFVALRIRHAMRVRLIVICGLQRCKYSSTFSFKRHDFQGGGGEDTGYKMCVLIFLKVFV